MAESLHLVMDQWIQCKLGKQYLLKKLFYVKSFHKLETIFCEIIS